MMTMLSQTSQGEIRFSTSAPSSGPSSSSKPIMIVLITMTLPMILFKRASWCSREPDSMSWAWLERSEMRLSKTAMVFSVSEMRAFGSTLSTPTWGGLSDGPPLLPGGDGEPSEILWGHLEARFGFPVTNNAQSYPKIIEIGAIWIHFVPIFRRGLEKDFDPNILIARDPIKIFN